MPPNSTVRQRRKATLKKKIQELRLSSQQVIRQADCTAGSSLTPPRLPRSAPTQVIGSGIGGLTTAAKLAEAGAKVAVFEKYLIPGGFEMVGGSA